MPQIQRPQFFAVAKHFQLCRGMPAHLAVMERRKGSLICADGVIAEIQRPPELNMRIPAAQTRCLSFEYMGGIHVHLLEIGQLIQKGFEGVIVFYLQPPQIDVFCILGHCDPSFIITIGDLFGLCRCSNHPGKEQHQDQSGPAHGVRSFPSFVPGYAFRMNGTALQAYLYKENSVK